MSKLRNYMQSSIGSKHIMGVTGLALCGFVIAHLAGNLLLLLPEQPTGASFTKYAQFLEQHPLLIPAELALLTLFLVHMLAALKLTLQNRSAKPVKYVKKGMNELKYLPSSIMGYTGLLVIIFVIIHLINFKYSPDHESAADLYQIVRDTFVQLPYAAMYVFFMVVLGIHLFHGFQSAFLTLGLDHPKYTPYVKFCGYVYAITMAVGFAIIPVYFYQGGVL